MEPQKNRRPSVSTAPKKRFRVQKLEERVAPKGGKTGWNNPNHPHYTDNCQGSNDLSSISLY